MVKWKQKSTGHFYSKANYFLVFIASWADLPSKIKAKSITVVVPPAMAALPPVKKLSHD